MIDQAFFSEVILNKSSLFHHVLWDWTDNAEDSTEKALNRVVLEKNVAGEELGEDAA